MRIILSRTLATIFLILAIIHFYWAFGGQWGYDHVLPTNEQGVKVLEPSTIDGILVGTGLLILALFYLFFFNNLKTKTLNKLRNIGAWIIPIIFMIRAIGDLKYCI